MNALRTWPLVVALLTLASPALGQSPGPSVPPAEATPSLPPPRAAEPEVRPAPPAAVPPEPPAAVPPEPPGDLEAGLAHFQARRFAQARPLLERAVQSQPANLEARLLLGITLHRLGQDREAEPLLRAAATSADAETASSARFFLGLIAADRGERDAARQLLAGLTRAPSAVVAESGRAVLERTRSKTLTLLLLARPEYDSNVKLLPSAATALSGTEGSRADGDLLLLAALVYRPFRHLGFSIEEAASYRQQFQITDYSIFGNSLGARYAYLGSDDRPFVSYGFELMTLGGSLLTLGQLVEAGYRRRLVGELWVGGRYQFRYRQYFQDEFTAFTGPSHSGAVELGWGQPERPFELTLSYLALRELTEDATFSATGHGGRLHARRRLSTRLELGGSFWVIRRGFDESDPSVGTRLDTQLYADVALGIDVHRRVGLIVGGSVLRNFSTDPSFDYLKVTAYVGVAFVFAGP